MQIGKRVLWLMLSTSAARADVTLLLEEPFGSFWSMNPAHSALYFSRVCAASPTSLRRCDPGESGAVLSRYHRIDGFDWVAIPLIPYLYAVELQDQVPHSATIEEGEELQDTYRRRHLESVAPDRADGHPPRGDWRQLVGEAYDRTLHGFTIQTTAEQDDELIRTLNSRPNHNRFNIVFRNCADFVREILDFYYPGIVRRSIFRDLGITTPRHVAACLRNYSLRHAELKFSAYMIPQVPGTAPRSRPIRLQ